MKKVLFHYGGGCGGSDGFSGYEFLQEQARGAACAVRGTPYPSEVIDADLGDELGKLVPLRRIGTEVPSFRI